MAKKPGISMRGTTYERVKAHCLSIGVGNPDWIDDLINADLDARGWPAAGMPPPIDFPKFVPAPKPPKAKRPSRAKPPESKIEPAKAELPVSKKKPKVSKGEPVVVPKNGSGENPPDGAGYCTF